MVRLCMEWLSTYYLPSVLNKIMIKWNCNLLFVFHICLTQSYVLDLYSVVGNLVDIS